MDARLVGMTGSLSDVETGLQKDSPLVIGRKSTADLRVASRKVSRAHCRIDFRNGFFVIRDLDSTNGTQLNGRSVSSSMLFHHDRIRVGDHTFRFELVPEHGEGASVIRRDDESPHYETDVKEKLEGEASGILSPGSAEPEGQQPSPLEQSLIEITRLAETVNSTASVDEALEAVADSAMRITDADRCYILMSDEPDGLMGPRVSRHSDAVPSFLKGKLSSTAVEECHREDCSILKSGPEQWEEGTPRSVSSQQISSIICVPIRCETGLLGFIYADLLSPHKTFQKSQMRLLSAAANHIGSRIRRAQLTDQLQTLFKDTIRTLVDVLESKDTYTRGHSERVTALAVRLAHHMHLDDTQIRNLQLAGLLHDIGKLHVPNDILNKEGSLTAAEYQTVKKHPGAGARIIDGIKNAEVIARAVRHHHERWDGEGYPDGIEGDDIPVLSQLLCIADAFDAMASKRPYRDELPEEVIVEEFGREIGKQFAPAPARKFLDLYQNDEEFRQYLDLVYLREQSDRVSTPLPP